MSNNIVRIKPRLALDVKPALNRRTLAALATGFAVLLAALFVPLPGLVLGEENLAAQRMPQTQAAVEAAGLKFRQAQSEYKAYVKSHDLAMLLTSIRGDIKRAKENSNDPGAMLALKDSAAQVRKYVYTLHDYAAAGEVYFAKLSYYDKELMSWTRSLGTTGEQIRRYTWPVADHLRLYPPPVGDIPKDIPWVTAAEVETQAVSLTNHIVALNRTPVINPHAPGMSREEAVNGLSKAVSDVWSSGRSIEAIESHHNEYYRVLTIYYGHIQDIIRTGTPKLSPLGTAIAVLLNLLVGTVTLVGLALFFVPRRRAT